MRSSWNKRFNNNKHGDPSGGINSALWSSEMWNYIKVFFKLFLLILNKLFNWVCFSKWTGKADTIHVYRLSVLIASDYNVTFWGSATLYPNRWVNTDCCNTFTPLNSLSWFICYKILYNWTWKEMFITWENLVFWNTVVANISELDSICFCTPNAHAQWLGFIRLVSNFVSWSWKKQPSVAHCETFCLKKPFALLGNLSGQISQFYHTI